MARVRLEYLTHALVVVNTDTGEVESVTVSDDLSAVDIVAADTLDGNWIQNASPEERAAATAIAHDDVSKWPAAQLSD